ncbi:MAG TPA: hemerythrin family protein [Rhodospirillaceae bacterium]|nr:hemerythrin family protein [Rhodospirillaceae bacterium]
MIVWSEEYRVGHPVIDADHQALIKIINDFHEKSNNYKEDKLLHETLKGLLAYSKDHFTREEKIQKECMYPYLDMHVSEHRVLVAQIMDMARTYFVEKKKPINKDSISYMNQFLKNWLIDHVMKFDTNMKEWLETGFGK